jgi:hypothetical protein
MMAAAVYLQEQAREFMHTTEPVKIKLQGETAPHFVQALALPEEEHVPQDYTDPAYSTGWVPLTPAEAFPPVVTPDTAFPIEEFEPAISNIHPEVDGRGFPWDKRIHSSSKQLLAKKPNGWKPLRGVDPVLVQTVEAEYVAAGYGKSASAPPPPAPAPAASTSMFPAPAAAPGPLTFAQVMARIGGANKLKEAQDAFVHFGVTSFPQLGQKPDAWESFLAYLGA